MLAVGTLSAAAGAAKYRSAQDALDQGIGAFNGGYYEIAVPALEYAADAHLFLAPYYLARIYSDNNGSRTDHAKAYKLYLKIAEEHTDVDPDDDQRAPYVAKAMTRIAGYLLNGLSEVNLKPNPKIAMEYLRQALAVGAEPEGPLRRAGISCRPSVARQVHAGRSGKGPGPHLRRRRQLAGIRARVDRGHLPEHLLRRRARHPQAGDRHRR